MFALGGSGKPSRRRRSRARCSRAAAARGGAARARSPRGRRRRGSARSRRRAGSTCELWEANSSNVARVAGRVLLNGAPVAGARVVDGRLRDPAARPRRTARFHTTSTSRSRGGASCASVGARAARRCTGKPLTAGQRSALLRRVGRLQRRLRARRPARRDAEGRQRRRHRPAASARTDRRRRPFACSPTSSAARSPTRAGKPVQGAVVITRTQDRDFWTHSSAIGRERPLHVVLRRLGRDRRPIPCRSPSASRRRQRLLRRHARA